MPSTRYASDEIPSGALHRWAQPRAVVLVAGVLLTLTAATSLQAQNRALERAASNGFQPLLIPVQSEPLVLPQPIRIPSAIMPSIPGDGQHAAPQSYSVSYPAVAPNGASPTPVAPLQQPAANQQRAMYWQRQGPALPLQPNYVAPVIPQGYSPVYPQVIYVPQAPQPGYAPYPPGTNPNGTNPNGTYPQAIYPQTRSGGPVYPLQPLTQPQAVPQVAPQVAPQVIPQPAYQPRPAPQQATLQPLPEFEAGKGALQGYKQAAEIAKARFGQADIVAKIDLSEQRMTVSVNGKPWYDWPVSTGRKGYRTPTGRWTVQRMYRDYTSKKYDNAPMPHAMFFHGPYAIHGTHSISRLGRPASHGCVRLHPKKAAMLFTLAEVFGKQAVSVEVQR